MRGISAVLNTAPYHLSVRAIRTSKGSHSPGCIGHQWVPFRLAGQTNRMGWQRDPIHLSANQPVKHAPRRNPPFARFRSSFSPRLPLRAWPVLVLVFVAGAALVKAGAMQLEIAAGPQASIRDSVSVVLPASAPMSGKKRSHPRRRPRRSGSELELEKPDGNLTAREGRRRKFTVHADTRRMYASSFQCMPSNFTQLGRSQSPAVLVAGGGA